ncbi:FGGY family carbohydrate kinase [Nocardioides pacificus]
MSVLALHVGTAGVTALVVAADGTVAGRGVHEVAEQTPAPGWVEHRPEEIWRAVLAATRDALTTYGGDDLRAVGITARRDTLLVWDRETLSSPRPAFGPEDQRADAVCTQLGAAGHETRILELSGRPLNARAAGPRLAWLAAHEPHTWALVEAERYAVGTVDSYLVARMTRGTWHLTDRSQASGTLLLDRTSGNWSDELCVLFGVPPEALPELVPSRGRIATTEPRVFAGLALPIAGLAAEPEAVRAGERLRRQHDGRAAPDSPAEADAAALGAAYLAGLGVGVWSAE